MLCTSRLTGYCTQLAHPIIIACLPPLSGYQTPIQVHTSFSVIIHAGHEVATRYTLLGYACSNSSIFCKGLVMLTQQVSTGLTLSH